MTGTELRDQIRAFSHADLTAILVTLCTGTYPALVRDSVIAELVLAELARRAPEAETP